MLDTSYLYGEDVDVPEIPAEIIVRRVEILKENLEELMDIHYLKRDNERCSKVSNAIKFWENINER